MGSTAQPALEKSKASETGAAARKLQGSVSVTGTRARSSKRFLLDFASDIERKTSRISRIPQDLRTNTPVEVAFAFHSEAADAATEPAHSDQLTLPGHKGYCELNVI